MRIRILAAAIAVFAAPAAVADFEIVTQVRAVEMSPSNMILPASTSGMMTYKPCADECDAEYERAQLSPETKFSVGGKAVKFEDFQEEFALARNDKDGYALLSVDITTKVVTSIDIAR